mmetsp:Transcript_17212/g.54048  ORF Transcript_17212/g.54048 Transcript_17212/m.54048 type:complete len:220 (+) Transcript_17212:607-1266(+)
MVHHRAAVAHVLGRLVRLLLQGGVELELVRHRGRGLRRDLQHSRSRAGQRGEQQRHRPESDGGAHDAGLAHHARRPHREAHPLLQGAPHDDLLGPPLPLRAAVVAGDAHRDHLHLQHLLSPGRRHSHLHGAARAVSGWSLGDEPEGHRRDVREPPRGNVHALSGGVRRPQLGGSRRLAHRDRPDARVRPLLFHLLHDVRAPEHHHGHLRGHRHQQRPER